MTILAHWPALHSPAARWLIVGLLGVAALSAIARLFLIARVAREVRREIARRTQERKERNDAR